MDQQGRQVLETDVKVTYDKKTDTMLIQLVKDGQVSESDETRSGLIVDYDHEGNPVSVEILDASKRITEIDKVEFELAS